MKKIKILLIALIMVFGSVFISKTYATNLKIRCDRPFNDPDTDDNGNNTYGFLGTLAGLGERAYSG